MKKLLLVMALTLGLVGSTGIRSAEAVFVNVNWATKSVISVTNPQKYQMSVYSAGTKQGPNFPPLKGGNVVMLDITDRTMTQLDYLTEDFGGAPGGRQALRTSLQCWIRLDASPTLQAWLHHHHLGSDSGIDLG